MLNDVLERIDEEQPRALERLFRSFGSRASRPIRPMPASCREAADWLVRELTEIGFDAARRDTPGHPMVVAHGGGEGPHFLFYGHYDVQPVDPLELWRHPPFEPVIGDGPRGKAIFGRGASDDKGQVMTFLEAVRAWKAVTGRIPGRLTVLLEGEEESSSPSLVPFLKANAVELQARLALVCDTAMLGPEMPAITTMLRGIVGEELTIHAASRDLHSGGYGGAAINPIRVLARIVAGLHDARGRITLPGFYDGVRELPEAIRAQWEAFGVGPETLLGEVGLQPAGGGGGAVAAGADLVAADLRRQRHLGRLHRQGVQDRAAGGGACQDQLPAGGRPGSGDRSSRVSGHLCERACRRTAGSASGARTGRGRSACRWTRRSSRRRGGR